VFALELPGPARDDVRKLGDELRIRGALLYRVGDAPDADLPLELGEEWLAPIPVAIAGQLLAFWLARARGLDPDRPTGLTKVTKTT
jgi:glucosamine--fructose-6-phosphate aminotransferase (isomerizing)